MRKKEITSREKLQNEENVKRLKGEKVDLHEIGVKTELKKN